MNDARPVDRVILPRGLAPDDLPDGFFPMRLALRTSDLIIVCDRPDLVVGRHSECDLRLPLPDVSRQHCRLTFRDRTWAVTDLGSTNGIRINDKAVSFGSLKAGDRLRIGSFTFDVRFPEAGRPNSPDDDVLRSIAATLSALGEVKADLRRVS